ncbi:mannan endo-1,4-beta-mannosidase 9 [Artemisia annua]|uniref:Mannan endo-1,4-beta-mannosidase 9 n=1 Tax=Artemisia annua TaxID=35608 RepID=A0A2U1L7V4_ARTAN|nr:mannan endo-1,4-beta-mannosidase 9 [Artemisia annua]
MGPPEEDESNKCFEPIKYKEPSKFLTRIFEDSKRQRIREIFGDRLNKDWYTGPPEDDDDDLECLEEYLELHSYDGFIDTEKEQYRMPYQKPSSITIVKFQVTRYMVGLEESYMKVVLTKRNSIIMGVTYKDDHTIFAWELMNEPSCQSDLYQEKHLRFPLFYNL